MFDYIIGFPPGRPYFHREFQDSRAYQRNANSPRYLILSIQDGEISISYSEQEEQRRLQLNLDFKALCPFETRAPKEINLRPLCDDIIYCWSNNRAIYCIIGSNLMFSRRVIKTNARICMNLILQ